MRKASPDKCSTLLNHLASFVLATSLTHLVLCILLAEKGCLHSCIFQLVMYLANLYHEVTPLLMVEREQTALFVFLGDGQIGATVCVFMSFVIAEVGFRQELMLVSTLVLKLFACKNVLLVDGIAFS